MLGDQLDRQATLLADYDPAQDLIWMCEAEGEATHLPSHKARTVLFLSAMRHFRDTLRANGFNVRYLAMFVDAVEWVEAPNTIDMSQYADGGLLAHPMRRVAPTFSA